MGRDEQEASAQPWGRGTGRGSARGHVTRVGRARQVRGAGAESVGGRSEASAQGRAVPAVTWGLFLQLLLG